MEVRRNEPLTGLEVGINILACKGKRYCGSGQPKAGYYRRPLAGFGQPPETLERDGCRNERVIEMAVMAHVGCQSLPSKLT